MKKISFLFLFILLGNVYSSVLAQTGLDNDLFNLAQMKSGIKNKRISSTDPTGGNRDHLEPFKPGEKRTIAEIKGTGVINHIWITMSPTPDQLSRNDIIIRMYWDGNDYPSVESPISGRGGMNLIIIVLCLLLPGPKKVPGLLLILQCLLRKVHALRLRTKAGRPLRLSIFM